MTIVRLRTCEHSCAFKRLLVPDFGRPDAPIMIMGEAPGAMEVQRMRPFVGPAGQKLLQFLTMAGINVNDVFFANRVHCRADDRNIKTPTPEEMDACLQLVTSTFIKVSPKVVVLMGNTAISSFFPGFKVGKIRGIVRSYKVDENTVVPMVPTYHPSAVLHGNHDIIPLIIQDLRLAASLLGEGEIRKEDSLHSL